MERNLDRRRSGRTLTLGRSVIYVSEISYLEIIDQPVTVMFLKLLVACHD